MLDIVEGNGRGVGVDRRSSRRRGFDRVTSSSAPSFSRAANSKKRMVVLFQFAGHLPPGVLRARVDRPGACLIPLSPRRVTTGVLGRLV